MAAGGPSIDFESPPVAIQTALALARQRLGMDLAFVSAVRGRTRMFTFVDSALTDTPVEPGNTDPLDEAYCSLVIDGTMPAFVSDVGAAGGIPDLPTRERYGIRAHAGVPLVLADGTVIGTFCCISRDPIAHIDPVTLRELRVLAAFVAEQIELDATTRAAWMHDLQAERRALVQSIAHEVRTPLTVIQGVADLIDRVDSIDPPTFRELVAGVAASSRRLAELADQVVATADALAEAEGTSQAELSELVWAAARGADAGGRIDVQHLEGGFTLACSRRTLEALVTAVVEHALLQSVPGSPVRVMGRQDGAALHFVVAYESYGVERTGERGRVQRTSGAGVRLLLATTLAREAGGRLEFSLVPDGCATIDVALPLVGD